MPQKRKAPLTTTDTNVLSPPAKKVTKSGKKMAETAAPKAAPKGAASTKFKYSNAESVCIIVQNIGIIKLRSAS